MTTIQEEDKWEIPSKMAKDIDDNDDHDNNDTKMVAHEANKRFLSSKQLPFHRQNNSVVAKQNGRKDSSTEANRMNFHNEIEEVQYCVCSFN